MRAAACCMVVALHVSGPFIVPCSQGTFSLPYLIDSFTRPSVPFFFMLSGYLWLNGKHKVYIATVYSRVSRSVLPLTFYTFLFLWLSAYVIGNPIANPFVAPAFYHLWFFYTFIVVSLVLAVIKPADLNPSIAVLIISALLFFCSGGMVAAGMTNAFSQVSSAMVYVLYAVLGYYLAKLPSSKIWLWLGATVFMVTTVALSHATAKLSSVGCVFDQKYFQYDSLFVVVQSITGFYVLCNFGKAVKIESKIVKAISSNSLGIYGIHPLPLYFLLKYVPTNADSMFPMMIAAFSSAFGAAYLIRKLPFGKAVA